MTSTTIQQQAEGLAQQLDILIALANPHLNYQHGPWGPKSMTKIKQALTAAHEAGRQEGLEEAAQIVEGPWDKYNSTEEMAAHLRSLKQPRTEVKANHSEKPNGSNTPGFPDSSTQQPTDKEKG